MAHKIKPRQLKISIDKILNIMEQINQSDDINKANAAEILTALKIMEKFYRNHWNIPKQEMQRIEELATEISDLK